MFWWMRKRGKFESPLKEDKSLPPLLQAENIGEYKMKKFIRLFAADMRRAVFSRAFFFSALGIAVLLYIASYGHIRLTEDGVPQNDVVEVVSLAFAGSSLSTLTAGIIALLPFGISYAEEVTENSAPFLIIRSGIRSYAASKYIAAMLSGFLVMVCGIYLYVLFLSTHLPVFSGAYNSGDNSGFDYFLYEGKPALYFLCFAAASGLSAAVCCGACVWISTLFPNRFTALIGPALLYLLLLRIYQGTPTPLPLQYSILNLVEYTYGMGSALATLGYKLLYISVFAVPMGLNAAGNMRRRLQNA